MIFLNNQTISEDKRTRSLIYEVSLTIDNMGSNLRDKLERFFKDPKNQIISYDISTDYDYTYSHTIGSKCPTELNRNVNFNVEWSTYNEQTTVDFVYELTQLQNGWRKPKKPKSQTNPIEGKPKLKNAKTVMVSLENGLWTREWYLYGRYKTVKSAKTALKRAAKNWHSKIYRIKIEHGPNTWLYNSVNEL